MPLTITNISAGIFNIPEYGGVPVIYVFIEPLTANYTITAVDEATIYNSIPSTMLAACAYYRSDRDNDPDIRTLAAATVNLGDTTGVYLQRRVSGIGQGTSLYKYISFVALRDGRHSNYIIGYANVSTGYGDFEYSPLIIFVEDGTKNAYSQQNIPYAPISVLLSTEVNAAFNETLGLVEAYVAPGGTQRNRPMPTLYYAAKYDITDYLFIPASDPYESGAGASGTEVGQGVWEAAVDAVNDLFASNVTALDSGFITAYNPSAAQLQSLGSAMWALWRDDATIFENLKRLFVNPMQAILGLAILPGIVTAGGSQEVAFGNIGSGISMPKIAQQFQKYSCGSVSIDEYSGSYMDYSPNTEISIFLPYCGTYQLDIDDVMGKTITCDYLIDVLSGGCIANLFVGGNLMYQFAGAMAVNIPVAQVDYSNSINGAISAVGNVFSNIATGAAGLAGMGTLGAIGGAALGLAKSAPSVVGSVMSAKPQVQHGGAIGSGAALAGCQVPYVIIKRPRPCVPARQNSFTGYPAFITYAVSDLVGTGYTEFAEIHLENIPGTDDEKSELEKILNSGVIL